MSVSIPTSNYFAQTVSAYLGGEDTFEAAAPLPSSRGRRILVTTLTLRVYGSHLSLEATGPILLKSGQPGRQILRVPARLAFSEVPKDTLWALLRAACTNAEAQVSAIVDALLGTWR